MRVVQGQGGEWGEGSSGDGDPVADNWGSHEWAAMTRAAAAAHEAAFWELPPEPVAHVMATTNAQHLQHRPKFKDALRDHPWHTVKGVATAKGTLVSVAGVAAAVVFVIVAVAAFSGSNPSDDVTLNGNPGGGDDTTRGFDGDKTRDGTTSTMADTTTAPSSSTTEATTTTTEGPDDESGDDDGNDPPVAPPPTTPGTEPPPPEPTTTASTTTTTTAARPVAQPAIDSFDVELDSWCSYNNGTVEATFRWTSRNGSSATLTSTSPGQQPITVGLTEDDFDVCPRPGDRWTLRVNGPSGTTPASRTITVPALPDG